MVKNLSRQISRFEFVHCYPVLLIDYIIEFEWAFAWAGGSTP